MGSLEVEGDSGRPQHEQHLSLLDNFSQAKWQLEQLLDADGDLAQLDGKLQELQMITTEAANHLPAASLRWVREQFGTLRAQVDEVRERLKPRKRFAFKSARCPSSKAAAAPDGTTGESQGLSDGCITPRRIMSPACSSMTRHSVAATRDARSTGQCESGPGFPADALKNASTLGFQGRSGETLMLSNINGKDMELDSLNTCEVTVHGCPATLFARRLKNCHIRCGPVATSVFVEECECCTFHIACQQLRVHNSHKCEFRVHIQARSIIEDSKELLFAKYDFAYDGDERDWCASRLDKTVNNWNKVDDFNWLAADQPSPNWKLSPMSLGDTV
ncbi:tubulin-specific chaperone C-like isoform X1 [Dermacentor andersoni]|uniref:tubulin-specific chaperone C-like isoform X1 n=1 Tax=Dermacentor andersoni TaxID=34620 RepID=UPI003B3BD576